MSLEQFQVVEHLESKKVVICQMQFAGSVPVEHIGINSRLDGVSGPRWALGYGGVHLGSCGLYRLRNNLFYTIPVSYTHLTLPTKLEV